MLRPRLPLGVGTALVALGPVAACVLAALLGRPLSNPPPVLNRRLLGRLLTAAAVILLIVLGSVLPACGPSPNPSPTPTALPTASPSSAPAADACHVDGQVFCTLNPDVTQDTVAKTICQSSWLKAVRPPSSYTDALKRQQMAQWDLAGPPGAWEEDHRMPLELGGAPRDPMNLSPEQPASPNAKDHAENALHQAVCVGQMPLEQARAVLRIQWLRPYPAYPA
jgi:hypothetical protein